MRIHHMAEAAFPPSRTQMGTWPVAVNSDVPEVGMKDGGWCIESLMYTVPHRYSMTRRI